MFTWISKTLLLPLLMSGCVAPGSGDGNARQTLALAGLRVVGPSGYCSLTNTRQRVSGSEFVAVVPCKGQGDMVLSATIGAPGSADGINLSAATLRPYFATEEGKAALRGAGNRTDQIAVHAVQDIPGAVILRVRRKSPGEVGESWRALMQIKGQLITLSARARQGKSVPEGSERRLIGQFVATMLAANTL
ncbi:hypothetical protein [Pseudorhodobacter sp.]|uniref:hypothetical protein n=1 Tax=Pseudorhodobacter sp. TaxID=1934400 RepID=UPI00264A3E4E|nr:hypothetical protein [Pseudorhodobacter sp.]MDN5787926.1 hypothetical protein [Pseudorhodobacter sp.]